MAGDEDQSRVVTRDDDYDDFTTEPTQEFLRKASLAKPVSTEQPSKKRKTVMFQEVNPVATDGQKSTSSYSVRRVSEIGVFPEREQLKSVPSSSSTPEGTFKSNLDMGQIKSYIKTYVNEQIAELKTLISNIPAEVVKALKKEENKESLHEDEYMGPVIHITNDEPTVLERLETEIQDCVHIHTECPTIVEDKHMNDQEEGHEEESKNTHITEMEDILDEHNDAEKIDCNEEQSRQHSPHMKHLEDALIFDKEEATIKDLGKQHTPVMDEHIATKGSFCADKLNKHHSTDVTDLQTLIFGLSTPLNTKKFDIVTPNLVTESQWSLPASQFPPDFSNAQVRELEAAKAREVKYKSAVKRDKKKSKIFRSPYITKFGSSSKDEGSSDNEEKQRKQTDNHYLKNAPRFGYPLMDFIVAQALSKNWFYLMTQPKMCWNDEVYVPVNCGKEYHWVLTVIVLKERTIRAYDSLSRKKKSEPLTEIRKLAAMLPTYLSDSNFFEKTERVDWSTLKAYEGKLGLQTGEISHNLFDVEYVQNIPQQASDSLNCRIFVAAYAEILSEGQQVPSCEFEADSQRARYASLLWNYGVTKAEKGYTSDNDDPPRPKNTFLQSPDESAIVTLE
ncbi:hypothetical protein BC332_01360 [Capsicum chinense]|nr:hypothetical protein BC332_01360 [Capsicum chinense]